MWKLKDCLGIYFAIALLNQCIAKSIEYLAQRNIYVPFDSGIKGKRGIIVFNVNWGYATGHIALYNGETYREPRYD